MGTAPQYSAHVCCRKVDGWIKMPLGIEVDLSQGHIVLDGDPAFIPEKGAQTQLPSQKRGHSPQFLSDVYCGETVAHLSYC